MKIISIKNENSEICSPCGGQCCKYTPGVFHPEQISKLSIFTKQNFLKLFHTGNYAIIRHCSDDKTYVLQPKTRRTLGGSWFHTWYEHGTCVFLKDTGCSFDYKDRPLECQKLTASTDENGQPNCSYPKEYDQMKELVWPWLPYQEILAEIVEEEHDRYWDKL